MQNLKPLFESATLKIDWLEGPTDSITLCFTGVGHAMGGLDIQRNEFTGTALSIGSPVFITDKTRSWGNSIDFGTISSVLDEIAPDGRRVSIGNSMGAFLAIATSQTLKVNHVLAFAPQYSVSPEIVPNEKRWLKYRNAIREFKIPSLAGQFNLETRYSIFHAEKGEDYRHWTKFPQQPNIANYVVSGSDHDVALHLKEAGALKEIITSCLRNGLSTTETDAFGLTPLSDAISQWKARKKLSKQH